jgi:DNA polymerase-3 subunit delta
MSEAARVYLYHGPDYYSAREALHSLRGELGVSDSNVVQLDGRTASLNAIISACHTATFFAEPRLVIIEELASRFSGRRRRSAGRSSRGRSAGATAESELDHIVEVLSALPDTTTVVLWAMDDPNRHDRRDQPQAGFLEAFRGIARIVRFDIKRSGEVRRWAEGRIKQSGGSISGAALARLCEMVDGYHLGELGQEIDKLVTFADGRRIDVSDIDEVGAGAVQHQSWDLTDAVIEGRAHEALGVLQRMDEKRYPAQLLFSMLVRQYRHVTLARAMLDEGFVPPRIGERLGISGFPLDKAIRQARKSSPEGLEQAYRSLLDADVAVKTGVMDIDTALEMVIVDLAEMANAGRRRPEAARPGRRS